MTPLSNALLIFAMLARHVAFTASTSENWLAVSPAGGMTGTKLSVSVAPSALAVGNYAGKITISSTDAVNSPLTLAVNLAVKPAPLLITADGVRNAASALGGPVAPGEIIAIEGFGLGPDSPALFALDPAGMVGTTLGGVSVLFDETPAPLLSVRASRIAAVVPYSASGKQTVRLRIARDGVLPAHVSLEIAEAAPAVFTIDASGTGQAALLNQDGSANSDSNPAAPESIVALYAAGAGQTDPPNDGMLAREVWPKPVLPITVEVGGQTAEVVYAGAAPGMIAGLLQVNFRLPAGLKAGNAVPVILRVGNFAGQGGVSLAVR